MIDRIGDKCTGCEACANICPKGCIFMAEDAEGFLFPKIDSSACIGCELCEKACPVLSPVPIHKTQEDVSVYALVHRDDEVRSHSSSGGAFSAISEYVLEQGGVVFGAAFDETFNVRHICVDNAADLYKLRGSKYVQSRIGDTYKQVKEYLKQERLVFFTGTACQTSGLLGYLGRDYENLITQDLICHGVPSPLAWRKYMDLYQRRAKSKVTHIFFRDKKFGWHNWHVHFRFRNGDEYRMNQREDMMVSAFLTGSCSRKSCYACHFKQKYRLADFTLADYWGIEKIAPELDDDKGISSVYVNSPKAKKLLDAISDRVFLKEMDLDKAVANNLAMVESERLTRDRDGFLRELRHRSFDMVYGKYIEEADLGRKMKWTARRILGNRVYERLLGKRG